MISIVRVRVFLHDRKYIIITTLAFYTVLIIGVALSGTRVFPTQSLSLLWRLSFRFVASCALLCMCILILDLIPDHDGMGLGRELSAIIVRLRSRGRKVVRLTLLNKADPPPYYIQ